MTTCTVADPLYILPALKMTLLPTNTRAVTATFGVAIAARASSAWADGEVLGFLFTVSKMATQNDLI